MVSLFFSPPTHGEVDIYRLYLALYLTQPHLLMIDKKYIFVTGGVCSSLGKGISASSIGALIEAHGYKVSMVKIDPYLNVDAGTMNPLEHGEVYVTHDGGETDLDLGNYERFTNHVNYKKHSITTGQVYQAVIEAERKGAYLGQCIQLIPHLTNEIKRRIQEGAEKDTDVVIIEVGGTVGDIESNPFLEAARQLRNDLGWGQVAFVHVTYVPFLKKSGECKTKPTQHSVQKLREIGIQPDVLLCRAERPLAARIKDKISLFTQVSAEAVIEAIDCPYSVYEVPMRYYKQGLSKTLLKRLSMPVTKADVADWEALVKKVTHLQGEVEVALVGKYVSLKDADLSVYEALTHAGYAHGVRVKVRPIQSEDFSPDKVKGVDAILVPGGFGERGTEGMIAAAHYAKQEKIPYLGICLGMQMMMVAHARHVIGLKGANSAEMNPSTPHPVIDLMESQVGVEHKGGTMRLGAYTSTLKTGSLLADLYGSKIISEPSSPSL